LTGGGTTIDDGSRKIIRFELVRHDDKIGDEHEPVFKEFKAQG
jgi:hypothetical protein